MRYHVLIAEDNSADVGLVREALTAHNVGCELQVASDGAAAIWLIQRLDADSRAPLLDVVMDVHLPKRDGEQILKCLRSTERYAQVPVVAMTSSESPTVEETATRHAALSYFRKPTTSSLRSASSPGAFLPNTLGSCFLKTPAIGEE